MGDMTAEARALVSEIDQLLRQRLEDEADIIARRALQAAAAREREACAQIAEALDSNRGNEKEIAAAIRARSDG